MVKITYTQQIENYLAKNYIKVTYWITVLYLKK